MGICLTPFRNSPGYHGPDLEYDTARNSWEGLSDPILGTLAALCWIRHCKEWIRPGEVLLELHVHPRPRLRLDMDPWLDASTPGCFRTRTSSWPLTRYTYIPQAMLIDSKLAVQLSECLR
jgi:hypothetical protein